MRGLIYEALMGESSGEEGHGCRDFREAINENVTPKFGRRCRRVAIRDDYDRYAGLACGHNAL